jgi:hypothetical protein
MATQIKLLAASNKVQFARKAGALTDVACINDNTKGCSWACRAFPEPIVGTGADAGYTFITFTCGSGLQYRLLNADFEDAR